MSIPIAVQLYTLRNEIDKDLLGTLEKVAKIGYVGVEFAGIPNLKAEDLKCELQALGLKTAGFHIPLDQLKSNIKNIIEYSQVLDNKYIVCPWAAYDTKEDFIKMAGELSKIGADCKKQGMELCYHNHHQEFVKYDEKYGLDIIYDMVDPELLKSEIDVYWVKYAGENPVDYLKKYRGRIPLVHIKDMEKGEERGFAEIGNGIIDIKAVAEEAEKGGAEWLIVEQDTCRRPPLECVETSYKNLQNMKLI